MGLPRRLAVRLGAQALLVSCKHTSLSCTNDFNVGRVKIHSIKQLFVVRIDLLSRCVVPVLLLREQLRCCWILNSIPAN